MGGGLKRGSRNVSREEVKIDNNRKGGGRKAGIGETKFG